MDKKKLLRLAQKLAKMPIGGFATDREREYATIIATEIPALIEAAGGIKVTAKPKPAKANGSAPSASV